MTTTAEVKSGARTRTRVPAPLLVLGGVVSVQLGAAVAKQLFPQLGAQGTVTLRLLTGAVLLWAVVRPSRATLARLDLRLTLAFGAVLGLMNLVFYLSLERIPLGIAVALEFLGPLLLALTGARRAREWMSAALAGVAVVLLTGVLPGATAPGGAGTGAGGLDRGGVLLALLAGACWAGYIVLSGRVGAATPGLGGLAAAATVAGLLVCPFGIATAGARLVDPPLLALGTAVGLLSAAVPYGLELVALRTLRSSVFAVLMSMEPAVGALCGFLVLRERLSVAEIAGVVLVCIASAGAARSR